MGTVLIHVCCAPNLLTTIFHVRDAEFFFYNPNIQPLSEYEKRREAVDKVANHFSLNVRYGEYSTEEIRKWYTAVKDYKDLGEGSKRCERCISFLLERTAQEARKRGHESFSTTLLASPRKNLPMIENIGKTIEEKYGVKFFFKNFRKGGAYQEGVRLSKELGIYRQNYCGCVFSLLERREKHAEISRKRGHM
uniref:Epoxyqueuosine reductase QueH n=1 Tax=Thermotoga maritima (strain ATCC 43589 / DSM 3109 / JCM 10099 / NBRC 100826 / MSB8) TaxID=243274 RepID=UPI0038D25A8B